MENISKLLIPRILIVEDESELRQILKIHISSMGFESEDCEDGTKALALLEKQHFDVVLTDMAMPKMNGFELLSEIRARGSLLPVIILSAFSEKEMILESMRLGIFDYIEKPFDPGSIKALLTEAIRVAHEQQKITGQNSVLAKRTNLFGKDHTWTNHEEKVIKRLRALSKDNFLPTKNIENINNAAGSNRIDQLKGLFVTESLQQLHNAERALRSISSGGDTVIWELAYLQRVMMSIEQAALAADEKLIAQLAKAIGMCFAVYRIRKSLLTSLKLGDLRKGHKLLEIKIGSIFSSNNLEVASDIDAQCKEMIILLNSNINA